MAVGRIELRRMTAISASLQTKLSCAGFGSHTVVFQVSSSSRAAEDNPATDIPLPKIRMGEIRALSHDECGRLLRVIETNRSPFRKLRDRAIVVTFLFNGREAARDCTTGKATLTFIKRRFGCIPKAEK